MSFYHTANHVFNFSSLPRSVQLQPTRPTLPIQHGAVQAVGEEERRGLHELPPQHRGPPLPLLQGGLLQGHGQADHSPASLQR